MPITAVKERRTANKLCMPELLGEVGCYRCTVTAVKERRAASTYIMHPGVVRSDELSEMYRYDR